MATYPKIFPMTGGCEDTAVIFIFKLKSYLLPPENYVAVFQPGHS